MRTIQIDAGAASRLRTLLNEAKLAYVELNIPAPCPPRGVVLVNQGRGLAKFVSPQHVQFAFSQGCDRPSYVATVDQSGGVGGLLMVKDGASSTNYFAMFDGNGNITGLVAQDGAVSARYEYGPFGEPIRNGSVPTIGQLPPDRK